MFASQLLQRVQVMAGKRCTCSGRHWFAGEDMHVRQLSMLYSAVLVAARSSFYMAVLAGWYSCRLLCNGYWHCCADSHLHDLSVPYSGA